MGDLALESAFTSGNWLKIASGGAAQTVKVGKIEQVVKNLPSHLCVDKYPSQKDSFYSVSYSGGASNAAEKAMNYRLSLYIQKKEDCAIWSITDATECSAYVILGNLTKFHFPDLPDYNFYFSVPAWVADFAKIKLKFTKVSWVFEQWSKTKAMDYTVYYEEYVAPPAPAPATTTTAVVTPTCALNAVLDKQMQVGLDQNPLKMSMLIPSK